ncbi:MAG: YigZ family protein [Methylophilaceae bacterium]|nr:YigZ family protein [Methylophilaceae bacterium]
MQSIAKAGQAEQTINKSRFVARAEYCANEREVALFLTKLATAHPHAHHLAFAYQIKNAKGITQRMHDAGEPSGTAGRPILQPLEGQKLVNVCVGVIRYYGGINLGTGGLARAYGGTAKMAIDAAQLLPFVEMSEISLVLDYAKLDSFTHALEKVNGKIVDKQFAERVSLIATLPSHEAANFQKRFSDV